MLVGAPVAMNIAASGSKGGYMPFFSEEDREARERITNPPKPSREEVIKHSLRKAQEELPKVLESIRKSYRDGSPAISFSFDSSPFRGSPRNPEADKINMQIVCEELVRLVGLETGLVCELDEGHAGKSGFRVPFK